MRPDIEVLRISNMGLPEGFLQPSQGGSHTNTKFLPPLRSLCLRGVVLNNDNWGHLGACLLHQTSDDQTISLEVLRDLLPMGPEVVNGLRLLTRVRLSRPGERGTPEQECTGHSCYL